MIEKGSAALFLSRWGGADPADAQVLEEVLSRHWREARRVWRTIELDDSDFFAHLAERAPPHMGAVHAATTLRGSDLYLACACAHGDREALRAFDAMYLAKAPLYLARLRVPSSQHDETVRALRERLFAGEEILRYHGRASLEGWLRAALATVAAARPAPTPAQREDLESAPAEGRAAFLASLALGLTELSPRERNLLRFHDLGDVTPGRLAALYGVHRATAMRWLAAAEERLLSRTEAHLRTHPEISAVVADDWIAAARWRVATALRLLPGQTPP